ncbi:hypothetical protein F2Q69_00049597 [Brassica cretica]|uniref:Uncharacterized protein n=1 Tax=Brassica cretica TaxID=69181 RepID=A0A8S9PM42_BRACR|nr:hypothetical protein F2Q69_00049597 [Brassica cretica]
MDTDEALRHLCHRRSGFSGAYEKRDSEKNRKGTRQGLRRHSFNGEYFGRGREKLEENCMDVIIVDMRLGIKFMSWEREEEAGGEVGTTMVSRSELRCGEDDATSSSRDVDKGCVGVIRVGVIRLDDNCVDVIVVDMRLGVKCEVVR